MIGKDQIYLNAFIKFCEESFPDESAITREIVDSWLCSYKKYLGDVLSQSDNIEDVRKAAELLIKLAEYKPLAKVEELEEENLNQIDNYLSNTVPKAEERKEIRNVEHERIEEEERKRRYKGKPSLRARLAEKKAIVAERGTVPQPEKHPVKILFENADGYDCVFVFADLFSTLYT